MRLITTIYLDNRHRQDARLLEDAMRECVASFNKRMGGAAHMTPLVSLGDDAEVTLGRYGSRVEGRQSDPVASRKRS
jgi:hypothetical protein